jgi:iron complex outermembrane receptor protein
VFGVTDTSFKQESLTIGELGFKGYLDNNKGYFDLNIYYGNVKNQQVTQAQVITALTPPTTLSIITNTGKTEIYGVEFTGNYRFTPDISLDVTGSYNHTKRKVFFDPSPATIAQFGISDFSGKKLHLAPIYSGSAVLSYEQRTSDAWTPFGNIAAVYRGKQYADIANYSYIPGRTVVDVRLGAKNEMFRIEAFVTNLFDNRTYPAGNVAPDFGINKVGGVRSSNSGFFGAYAEPRTFGVRASVKI